MLLTRRFAVAVLSLLLVVLRSRDGAGLSRALRTRYRPGGRRRCPEQPLPQKTRTWASLARRSRMQQAGTNCRLFPSADTKWQQPRADLP